MDNQRARGPPPARPAVRPAVRPGVQAAGNPQPAAAIRYQTLSRGSRIPIPQNVRPPIRPGQGVMQTRGGAQAQGVRTTSQATATGGAQAQGVRTTSQATATGGAQATATRGAQATATGGARPKIRAEPKRLTKPIAPVPKEEEQLNPTEQRNRTYSLYVNPPSRVQVELTLDSTKEERMLYTIYEYVKLCEKNKLVGANNLDWH